MTKPDEDALAGIRLKLLRAMATWMRSTVKLTPSSTDTRLTRQARCGQVPLSDWRVLASLGAGHGDRLHTLIPRETALWKALYRSRGSVEREFGRLKHEWSLLPLRVRRIERVAPHVDLTIFARLASALADARAVPLAACADLSPSQ